MRTMPEASILKRKTSWLKEIQLAKDKVN